MVLFDECGPVIPVLKTYRQDVACAAYDECADRERSPDADLEDRNGQLALDHLIGDRASRVSSQYFEASIERICEALADHCVAYDVLSSKT